MKPGKRGSHRLINLIRDAVHLVGPRRGLFYTLCGVSIVNALLETAVVYLIARVALAASSGSTTSRVDLFGLDGEVQLHELILAAGACVVVLCLLAYPTARLVATISSTTLTRARTRLITAYLGSSWSIRSRQREGHLQEVVGHSTTRAETLISTVCSIVVSGFSLLALVVGALVIAPVATLVGVAGLMVLSVLGSPASRSLRVWAESQATSNKEFASEIAQTVRISQEIAAFDTEPVVTKDLNARVEEASAAIHRTRFLGRIGPTLHLYGAFAIVVVLLLVVINMDPEDIVTLGPLVLLFVRGLGYGKQLQASIHSGLELAPYTQIIDDEITELNASPIEPGQLELTSFAPVAFRDVEYSYVAGSPVLHDVGVTIQPGAAIGVVGPSGGGKTTFTQLLLRLRQPDSGVILVGETPLADVTPASWAAMVGFVPQENKLIRATVADNIRFFRPNFTADEVETAARSAHLHDEIVALPSGYDTVIGSGERDLSGGQCQRLGIARALLGNPRLLVLDEPTSALDPLSENLIRQTLLDAAATTTLVIIAHRPATLEICDTLFRVQDGRVVTEVGPAAKAPLVASKGGED